MVTSKQVQLLSKTQGTRRERLWHKPSDKDSLKSHPEKSKMSSSHLGSELNAFNLMCWALRGFDQKGFQRLTTNNLNTLRLLIRFFPSCEKIIINTYVLQTCTRPSSKCLIYINSSKDFFTQSTTLTQMNKP